MRLWFRKNYVAVPMVTEGYEARRRRELLVELKHLDLAMASLLDDVRSTRMQAGLVSQQGLPSPMMSARVAALELGRSSLIEQRNVVLRELASL